MILKTCQYLPQVSDVVNGPLVFILNIVLFCLNLKNSAELFPAIDGFVIVQIRYVNVHIFLMGGGGVVLFFAIKAFSTMFCSLTFLLFQVKFEKISLICIRHHCRWRNVVYNWYTLHEQGEIFILPHVLWHVHTTSVFAISSKRALRYNRLLQEGRSSDDLSPQASIM